MQLHAILLFFILLLQEFFGQGTDWLDIGIQISFSYT